MAWSRLQACRARLVIANCPRTGFLARNPPVALCVANSRVGNARMSRAAQSRPFDGARFAAAIRQPADGGTRCGNLRDVTRRNTTTLTSVIWSLRQLQRGSFGGDAAMSSIVAARRPGRLSAMSRGECHPAGEYGSQNFVGVPSPTVDGRECDSRGMRRHAAITAIAVVNPTPRSTFRYCPTRSARR